MEYFLCISIVFLVILGAFAARTGGSGITKAIIRITLWGTIANGINRSGGIFLWSKSIIGIKSPAKEIFRA